MNYRMGIYIGLLGSALLLSQVALAAEEEGGEKKEKPPEKPRPDSVISMALQLPDVKKWGTWIESKKDKSSISVWGESVREIDGHKCSEVVVGESDSEGNTTVWARFCISQSGSDVWVESKSADSPDEIIYIPYDAWVKKCKPTGKSPGIC